MNAWTVTILCDGVQLTETVHATCPWAALREIDKAHPGARLVSARRA